MSELRKGRVIRMDAKVCHVDVQGEVVQAAPRGLLFEDLGDLKNPVAVGDWVLIEPEGDPVSLVEVLERENYLGRTASSHDPREQILAANVDQLFVIASVVEPRFSSTRTDRILAACEWHQIPASLVVNKIDLARPEDVLNLRRTYESVPYEVLETCALDGRGLDALRERLEERVSIFYGSSGAGKSTILNRLQPSLALKEGRISRYWEAGRHTTSFSQMHRLDFGGWVVDTPGIRVFKLWNVHRSELKGLFPEFARYEDDCKFPNCTHDHEPDCAVLDALEEGAIARSRYMSYLELLLEASPDTVLDEEGPPPDEDEE